jgi:regulator of replication initiation timing
LLRTENAYLREQLGLALQKDALAVSSTQTPLARPSEASHRPVVIVKQDDTTHSASPSPLPAQSIMLPVPGFEGAVAADVAAGSNHNNHANISDLTQRLADSQRLLTTMAMENSRLAAENERLRAGGMQVSTDYSGAVEEVEWLRSKLAKLEAQLLGASFNSDEKTKVNVEKESDAEHGNGVLWIDESMPDGFAKADGHDCLQEESMPGGSDTSA